MMVRSHVLRVVLILALQAAALAVTYRWQGTSLDWLSGVGFWAALLLPLACYILAFYYSPMFTDSSRLARTVSLTLMSFLATCAGLVAISILLAMLGFRIRG